VETGQSLADGRREVTFTVTDTGIGIPGDKTHLLFNSFSQVDASHTRRFGGAGLGLVISKEIVEQMQGEICFESEAGTGSTFSVTIPFRIAEGDGEVAEPAQVAVEAGTAATTQMTGEGRRILVAEDDPTIRRILAMILERLNYQIDLAENGQAALELWAKGGYSLVLMDVQMPIMDGFAATRTIREREADSGEHTLIVAMTAHASSKDEERCLAAGMDAYISKPIDLKKSIALINELISKGSQAGEPAAV
jgi:CheY-like chemotaxis protein